MQERTPLSESRDFSTFFSDAREWTESATREVRRGEELSLGNDMRLGTYLTVRGGSGREKIGYGGFTVTPTHETKRLVEASLIAISHDTLHYNLILFDDGATLYVQYGLIIGDRLLARLDLSTLPEVVKQHIQKEESDTEEDDQGQG